MSANFTVIKKGYAPKEVDDYIKKLEDALKEYRDKEHAISRALINAEETSKQIIKEAREQARTIMEDTHNELDDELKIIEKMITGERKALEDFCVEYNAIIKNYFTGNAYDITSPLREKINLIECILHEARGRKPLSEAENTEIGEALLEGNAPDESGGKA